jgi:hypothetical protein
MSWRYISIFVVVIILFSLPAFAQLDSVFYTKTSGTVGSGVLQTTDNFTNAPIPIGEPKVMPQLIDQSQESMIIPKGESQILPPYKYIEDRNATENPQGGNGQTVILNKFEGIPMTQYVPPDPTIAVGPNHVIVCANDVFRIYDKQGNLLKNIGGPAWWLPLSPYANGDPQVIYDHFMERWVLVWMEYDDNTFTYGDLVAYSDDSNPLGDWYLYRFPNPTLGDYPKLGFDDEALYIMWRTGSSSIRIINKAELYSSNGGPVSFTRLYNIGTPGGGPVLDCITPAISYTSGNGAWFLWALGSYEPTPVYSDYYAIYKITNPLTNPGLRGKVLNVQPYYTPPFGGQLGGGLGLETLGWMSRAPVVRDGYLYAVHDVANSTNHAFSSVKYIKVDLSTPSIVENIEFGNIGYYYLYPACTVDKDHNLAITFSRSATTEFVGGYFATKLATDTLISPSLPIAEGQGNYVVDFGSGRNRWGDYLGIYLDPVDENNVWIFPEYAAATNTWGTMVGQIRMVPFNGYYTFLSSDSLAFGNVEINFTSDTLEVVIANYGTNDLEISSIADEVGPFKRVLDPTFPQTLSTYDSITIKVYFSPTELGDFDEVLAVNSNDPALSGIKLTGHSYRIVIPSTDIFYASSGGGNNGDMITIDRETGVGTTLGSSLFGEITSLAVNPNNDVLYGLVAAGSNIVRVNADQGDAYTLFSLDIPALTGIDFDNTGTLYASNQNGNIYSIDLTNGDYTLVTTATIQLKAIAFNPTSNELWGAIYKTFGLGKDSLFTINLTTGEATPVGKTGFSVATNDMAFDEDNKLYGVTGSVSQEGKLFEIDQADGTGTLIGTGVGFNHTTGLAFSINGPVVSVDGEQSVIPEEYSLKQNYPNPFNPTTKIEFALPVTADVELVVYNILGQQIATLINEQRNAGNHSIFWNADDSKGIKLSSGVYLYMLKATGNNGSEFQETKKMVLLK